MLRATVRPFFVAFVVLVVGALSGCDERPQPPEVAPKPAKKPTPVVDAGPPPTTASAPDEPPAPDNVLALPEHVKVEDAVEGEPLIRLLLEDPSRAEKALHRLGTPDGWQVALMAQMALQQGEARGDALPETALPVLAPDAGVPAADTDAWVAAASLPLKDPRKGAKGKTLLELPLNTRVHVEAVTGALARVSVEVAREVDYDDSGSAPTRVVSAPVKGLVDGAWLVAEPLTGPALVREAKAQPDDDAGNDRAVVLWHRALLVERSEAAREGLLRAAWQARRPSWVIRAALTRNFAPARAAALAWTCRGDPAKAKWLPEPKKPPKTLPSDVCLTEVDARASCAFEPQALRTGREARAAWRKNLGLEEKPLLRLTVDARQPRAILLAGSRVAFHDSCAEFEEVDLESHAATLRRLVLPLGVKDTVVRVPVPAYHGLEYAVLSASSEARAGAWMRSRSRYRWSIGPRGQLQVSLQTDDMSFAIEADAAAATVAVPPQKACDCNDD